MGDFNQPESKEDFLNNFQEVKPLMNSTEALYESARCLFCYDAPCITACPTEIDIPLFIRQINTNNITGASNTIYRSNWLGNICGQVCPTEVLCEGACVYNHQNVKPIEIGRLQSYATAQAIKSGQKLKKDAKKLNQSVAVVGAGPAGLSAACELSNIGYDVTILEARSMPSGLALHGVAPYKITNEQVLAEVEYLKQQFGFTIEYNHPIANSRDMAYLDDQFQAIFLGIGLGATRSLKLPGENLHGNWGAVEFIETLKISQHQLKVPQRVVVLGGGNTAMDAASECARMGAKQVILAYRKGLDQMGAYRFEYEMAKNAGVQSLWFVNPLEILGSERVEAVKFKKTRLENDKLAILDEEYTVPCDMVIRATGQSKQVNVFSLVEGIQYESDGGMSQGKLPFQTTNPKYFVAGDAFNGGLEVVNAVAEAKKAAVSIHQYLQDL
ncbi:MAG: dihydropyrimidine dehydrogenase subunit A [Cyclobacteriaceae bacterium]|nr:MAG: dihydropyrimidine dehydrogenase subunit A [Cyclobacteriaceae bacterium]